MVAAAIVVAALGVGTAMLRRPIPPRSGTRVLPGLSAPVRVLFDARGVPHVRAATERDAWRVLGWLHAGDRFFQMETRRRAALGTLSELVGPGALEYDVDARRAGHARMAERDEETLSPGLRESLEAYAQGVSAYMAAHARPLELVALGDEPRPWTVRDSLAFGRLMLAGLSEAPGRIADDLRARGIVATPDGRDVLPAGRGSNAWAVTGRRSMHGKPILANDPHLAKDLPGVWYAAHLTTMDGLDVAGLTVAGAPGVVIGRSAWFAWGITMAQVDDGDAFLEELDPRRRTYVRHGVGVPLVARSETIRVKGAKDVVTEFLATDRGTLLGGFTDSAGRSRGVALAFAPERGPVSLRAFADAARARDAGQFDAAWAGYGGPAVNVCWASAQGNIGHRLAGSVPVRRSDWRDERGFAVLDWDGLVRDEDLPRIVDPPEGFVASANDDWSASGRRLPFRGFYATGDRVGRIRELLADPRPLGPADMNGFQNDVRSPFAVRLIARLAEARLPDRGPAPEAMRVLREWDGRAARTGPARLFYAVLDELAHRIRVEGFGRFREAFDSTATDWDDPGTPSVESQDDAIAAALASAIERVRKEDGPDPARWSWGKVHTLRYEHPFSNRVPLPFLRRFLDVGPFEMGGEIHTLNVQGFRLGREPRIRHIPSARMVLDLGDPDASTLVLPLGESGQFQDPHYDDQAQTWARGGTFPFPWTTAGVERAATSTLTLEP